MYYHGARYYIPWLCRWSAVDPLESNYTPWSSYNYGFDNPVRFTDPTGKEGEEKNTPQFKNGSNFPLEKNYAPVSSTSEMTPDKDFSFSYKWGGSVTKYHDDALDRDFSVLEQRSGTGEQRFFSWVSKETGRAEIFTGYNKDKAGEWTGRWVEFESAEKRNVRLANETADAITKGFVATGIGLFALPGALSGGVFSVGLSWSSLGGAAGNFTGQMLTKEGNFASRLKDVNWVGVASSAVFKNPLGEEIVANTFKFTINEKRLSFTATENGGSDFFVNVAAGSLFGKYADVGLDKIGLNSFGGKRNILSSFGRSGIKAVPFITSTSVNTLTETAENVITNSINERR